jgi:transposase
VIEALQALRGVAQTTAASIVRELGSLSRFPSPRQLMGYSGLVAREHSSGNRIQRGGITKTGNGHLRRVLMEAAWAYQHRPNVIGFLLRRKAWRSARKPRTLPGRPNNDCINATGPMAARGKNKNQIVTAIGREMLGFIWAIAVETQKQPKLAQVA